MIKNWHKICRMCSQAVPKLKSLFSRRGSIDLPSVIKNCLDLEVLRGDELPQNVCEECISKLKSMYENRTFFIENEQKLRSMLVLPLPEAVELKEEFDEIEELAEEKEPPELKEDKDSDNDFDVTNHPFFANEPDFSSSDDQALILKKKVQRDANKPKKKRIWKKKKLSPDFPRLYDQKCYICLEKCESEKNLIEHLSKHTDKLPFQCDKCLVEKVEIKSLLTLNAHLKMHCNPIKCEYCDRRYSTKRNKDYHINTFHLGIDKVPQNCEICDKECTSLAAYKLHKKLHTNQHQCSVCQKSFMSKSTLKRHLVCHKEDSEARIHECGDCGNKYKDMQTLKIHRRRHNKEKAYDCKFCPENFYLLAQLKQHLKNHASPDYKPKRNMKQYYTIVQNEETKTRQYKCNFCGQLKKDSSFIHGHLQTHLKPEKCSFCDRSFSDAGTRRDHENTHTGNKPHICKTCGKGFANVTNLYQHYKIHTGVKNYKCEFCSQAFTYKENMKSHIKNHHSGPKADLNYNKNSKNG